MQIRPNVKKFYNREHELNALRNPNTSHGGVLSVVVGRRRVGKTRLLTEAFKDDPNYLYFFVSRKHEKVLVQEYTALIQSKLSAKWFRPESLRDIIEYLLDYSTHHPITLVMDEFQDIQRVNPSFFSDLQNLWDTKKNQSQMHLVVCGSLYNLMTRIFKNNNEPLFNRHDYYYHIKPLSPNYLRQIMIDNNVYTPEEYLLWWCLSGGIPIYIEWLLSCENNVIDELTKSGSTMIFEGRYRLVEDFGDENSGYFDILAAIASGYNTAPLINNFVGCQINNKALKNLTDCFGVIKKVVSLDASINTKTIRYKIVDPFLKFWFTFIYKNRSAVNMGNLDYVKDIVNRDYTTYSGLELEHLIEEILIESKRFNRIGGFWDRKGKHEIDVVAINDANQIALFIEVKRQQNKYEKKALEAKANYAVQKLNLKKYQVECVGVSLDTLDAFLDQHIGKTNE